MAEGEGFELPVRFRAAKPRRVRNLQIANVMQRILAREIGIWALEEFGSDRLLLAWIREYRPNPAPKWNAFELCPGTAVRSDWLELGEGCESTVRFPVSFVTCVIAVRLLSQVSFAPGRTKSANL